MESEAPVASVADNATNSTMNINDVTPMETDDNVNNNPEISGEARVIPEQQMDADNAKNEGQPLESIPSAGSLSESTNPQQSSEATAPNATSQSEQLDTAHENLATLAAVSAAGAEVNANPTQPSQTQSMEASNANPSAGDDATKAVGNSNINSNASPASTQITNALLDEEDAKWHTVGIFQGLSTTVTSYIDNTVWSSSGLNLNAEDIPDLSQHTRINLEPGTAYRFRIRALNSVGTSDWSEISSFKTCLPGFPGAPSAIKISKSSEGAHLTWEPPPSCVSSNEIVEYSVYLAVKPGKEKETKAGQRGPAQLAFVRVYVGAANQCTVSHSSLSAAHVDCSNKPAIIFRIAARNEKGYGPATQVRWLQDPVQNSATNPSLGPNSLLSPTRVKPELVGASPSKRFKAGGSSGR